VDTLTLALAIGDVVLLCSDGLSAMVRDDEIVRVLESSGGDPHQAAEALVRAANAAGGDDNVTVVVFELVEGDPAARDARPAAMDGDVTAEDVGQMAEPARDDDDVRRHGAGKGSRWPALLLVLVILAVAALVLWWSLLR
jgi:PPM family protein phosphatase